MKSILNSLKKTAPFILVTIVVVAALVLVSCAKEVYIVEATTTTTMQTTTTIEATTTTERATTTTVATLSPSDMFLADVYANTDLEYSNEDSKLIDLGWTICEFLGSGYTGEDVIEIILEAGAQNNTNQKTMLDYAALSGLAVAYLCPEYGYKL